MVFGEKIKTMRKTFKLSQEELANRLHVSRQIVTKWETGGGLPGAENLKAIAALFGTSIDDLLNDETEPVIPILIEKAEKEK